MTNSKTSSSASEQEEEQTEFDDVQKGLEWFELDVQKWRNIQSYALRIKDIGNNRAMKEQSEYKHTQIDPSTPMFSGSFCIPQESNKQAVVINELIILWNIFLWNE